MSRSSLVPFALACREPIEPQRRFRCKGLIVDPAIVVLPRLDAAVSHRKKLSGKRHACLIVPIIASLWMTCLRFNPYCDLYCEYIRLRKILALVEENYHRFISYIFLLIVTGTSCCIWTDNLQSITIVILHNFLNGPCCITVYVFSRWNILQARVSHSLCDPDIHWHKMVPITCTNYKHYVHSR